MTTRALCALAALVFGIPALADEGEGYAYLSAAPVYGRQLDVSPDGQVAGLFAGVGGQAIVLYSLTHELQLGGAVHANYYPSVRFGAAGGVLRESALGVGASAVAAVRIDTGYGWAPFGSVHLGGEYLHRGGRQWQPGGGNYGLTLDASSQFAVVARAGLGLEYRIDDHWVATLSVAYRRPLARGVPAWQVEVPLALGLIW
jgi:hypothetical protein